MQPRAKHRAKPAFLRPNKANKANKAKLSSVSECLHSGVSLVRGGQNKANKAKLWGGHIGAVSGWVGHKAKLLWQTCRENLNTNDP